MKKIIVIFAIGISSINMSFASNHPALTKEIEQKVSIDIKNKEIEKYNQTYLTVSFKIINGKIKIEKINGSSSHKLKVHIINKLTHLSIDSSYEVNKEYTYKFIFKK